MISIPFIINTILALAGIVFFVLFILSFILPVGLIGSRAHGSARLRKRSTPRVRNHGLVIDGIRRISLKQSFQHAIVMSPTGAGKTTNLLMPNIGLLNTSMIITDPKGELHDLFYSGLEARGYKVLLMDFGNPMQSLHYSPMLRVEDDADERQLATLLFDMSNKNFKGDGIWRNGAIKVLLFLVRSINNIPDTRYRNMSVLLQLLNYVEDGTDRIEKFVQKYAPDTNTLEQFYAFTKQEVKIKLGQLASAQAALSIFDTKAMKVITSSDDLDFISFRKQKTALFLKVPVGKSDRFAPLISIFYTQLFHHLLNRPIEKGELPICVLLEEFGNLRKIDSFHETLALIRSRQVSISIILQNLSQLISVYGKEDANTILANTASLIVYPGIRDEPTLKFIESLLGQTTKQVHNLESSGIQLFKRSVMTPDEVRTMGSNEGLYIFGNKYGQKIRPLPFYKNYKLMKKSRIISKDGQLKPLKEFIPPDAEISLEIPRFPIEKLENEETLIEKELENEELNITKPYQSPYV